MAPASDRDKDPKDSPQSSGNPFIKFRQFADAQIGSLLQGVIGLPSAFTKSPENTRWADFDDDLRRRDELQARQKALRDSEARRLSGTTTEEEVSIPVKKSPDWAPSSTTTTATSATKRQMDDEGERRWLDEDASAKDWPLYSSITRSLFSRLRQSIEDDVDWDHQYTMDAYHTFDNFEAANAKLPFGWERRKTPEGRTYYVDHNERSTTWNAGSPYRFLLRKDQKSSDILRMVQYMAYNNLNKTATAPTPYWGGISLHADTSLLPYLLFSPYSPLKLSESKQKAFEQPDNFPYREAFEDLLLLHHGQPMVARDEDYSSAQLSTPRDEISRAKNGMRWIYALGLRGLLSSSVRPKSLSTAMGDENHRTAHMADSMLKPSAREAHTEQEMYDRFLRSASSPSSTSVGVFDVLFSDAEKFVKEQLASLEKQSEKGSSLKPRNTGDNSKPSAVTPQPSSDAERVVSTVTTSNHVKHEDGTVETTLSVRKVFADGRTTVTETSHTELPCCGDELDQTTTEAKQSEDRATEVESGSGKKGWFWN